MKRHGTKVLIAVVAVIGVTGVGAAVAADSPDVKTGGVAQQLHKRDGTGPYHAQQQRQGGRTGQRLRKRDGTGPRHAQNAWARRSAGRDVGQQGRGTGGGRVDCPLAD